MLNHSLSKNGQICEETDIKTFIFLISQINKDGCGKTKSCYSEPANCKGTSDCDFLVTIRPLKGVDCNDDNGEVEFELSTNKDWASIGFNKEKKMVRRGTNHF